MADAPGPARRHESLDHVAPTDAGLMDPDGGEVPGTGVMGDETLVRPTPGADGAARTEPALAPGVAPEANEDVGERVRPGSSPR